MLIFYLASKLFSVQSLQQIPNCNMLEDICDIALSIHFPKSEDNQTSEVRKNEFKNNSKFEKFKCFKCYGTSNQSCLECQGARIIQFQHPMAKLLNSILQKKLNLEKEKQVKEEQQLEQVYPIKEQQQDIDQRKLICSFCQCDCEQVFYYCATCPFFHICQVCQKKSINHEHQILKSKLMLGCKIQVNTLQSIKKCFNCAKYIQNCYSICKTCQEKGVHFWICDSCSDSKTYIHSTVMDYNYNEQSDNHIETVSQQFQIQQKSIEFEQIRIEEAQNLYFREQISKHILVKKNSSILNYVDLPENYDIPPTIFYNKSTDNTKKKEEISRVRFEFDENLFNSYQFNLENKQNIKMMLCPPKVSYQDRFSYTHSQGSHSNYKQNCSKDQNHQFQFSGYRCDICQAESIKSVRYHCTTCEDYDVCQKCYEICLKTHAHITFDKIDHAELRKKAMNKILQQRDFNMKGSGHVTQRKSIRSKTGRFSSINS